jgi:two-component system nitrogen regulation response regulator NtrX
MKGRGQMADETILIVDDEEGIRESLSGILEDEGYRVHTAASAEEALDQLDEVDPSLVFLDVWLPGMDGIACLTEMRTRRENLTVVMISGHGNIETAVNATRMGAYDFLEKPLSLDRVLLVAERALESSALQRENRTLRQSIQRKWTLVGESKALRAVRAQIEMAARSNGRVLITGESGTGKELVAHQLHELSPRAAMPFVEVNCAAIPQELIESELFGHEKGSFTGAFEQKKGKFELADKGTLFLDEIGDMSFQTQAKLLRVLESQQFQRVGGSRNIKVDTRVVAATNKDIEAMIDNGEFRGDLFFRLNVIPIKLPPLRERKEDIGPLVNHFLAQLGDEYGQSPKRISARSIEALSASDWPGNIRELRNMIERLVIMSPGQEIEAAETKSAGLLNGSGLFKYSSIKEAREAFEQEFILRKLEEHGWNISRTAETLQIERSNLHKKIKTYGIKLP